MRRAQQDRPADPGAESFAVKDHLAPSPSIAISSASSIWTPSSWCGQAARPGWRKRRAASNRLCSTATNCSGPLPPAPTRRTAAASPSVVTNRKAKRPVIAPSAPHTDAERPGSGGRKLARTPNTCRSTTATAVMKWLMLLGRPSG